MLLHVLIQSHLHLQDLLQSLHDDQCGLLDCRIAVLGAVLDYFHQSLIGSRAQVVLVPVGPEQQTFSVILIQTPLTFHFSRGLLSAWVKISQDS